MNLEGAIVYLIIVIASYTYAFRKDKTKGKESLKKGWRQFLKQIPFILSIFLLIGLFDVFIPQSVVVSILGRGKGVLAIFNAAIIGSVVGGPVSSVYLLGAVLLKKGATVAVTAVFMNAWVIQCHLKFPFLVKNSFL